jgi:hypothetical protein
MQVVTGGDQTIGSDGLAQSGQKISLGIVHPGDIYRPVHV